MNDIKIPVLAPIRFFDPNLTFGVYNRFQNPDNRMSNLYDWEGINSQLYPLPIPKLWKDGNFGIDTMVTLDSDSSVTAIRAEIYDSDDVLYGTCWVQSWITVSLETTYRVAYDCSGATEGCYTVKIIDDTTDDVLMRSEWLSIKAVHDDMIPFEFTNFENDFGLVFDNGNFIWTSRMMVPIRLFDPQPQLEKEVYKDDPGTLVTLRSIPQRSFNFDSLPIPVHVAEFIQLGFACSELYLDGIKINSEEVPEAELVEGTNMKQLSGVATFVDFNTEYIRERVEASLVDEGMEWSTETYASAIITANEIVVADEPVSGSGVAVSDNFVYSAGLVIVQIELTDDGDSDLPVFEINNAVSALDITGITLGWGLNTIAINYKANGTISDIQLQHSDGEDAVYTAVIDLFTVS